MFTPQSLAEFYINGTHSALTEADKHSFSNYLDNEYENYVKLARPCFVKGQPYASHTELFRNISRGEINISTDYNNSLWLDCEENLKFRYVHDIQHFIAQSDFSLYGEIKAFLLAIRNSNNTMTVQILFSEIVLQASAQIYLNYFPSQKLVLVDFTTISQFITFFS